MDQLDDSALSTMLRRRADDVAGPVDTDAAWRAVATRGRARRRWRYATTGLGAVAATIIAVVALVAVTRDGGEIVRTPATQPSEGSGPTTAPVPPTISATTTPATGVTTTTVPTTQAPTPPPAVTTTVPAPPLTSTYPSTGGSITVRLADGQISLAADPVPTGGWTTRIDDNGPDRVRVRFELGNQRSEIRVDRVGGQLVPRITES